MNLNTLSPYVRRAMHSEFRKSFKIGQRIIFDYELIYLEQGSFLFVCDGKEYVCNKGDFIFIRPAHPHTMLSINGKGISQPHIHFDMCYDQYSEKVYISFKDIQNFSENEKAMIREDLLDIGPILHVSDRTAFTTLFYEIIETFEKKQSLYQLTCKEKMIKLLAMIIGDNTVVCKEEEPAHSLPAMIKHYIDYSFQNPITLDALEKQFHYSKFHIGRTFLKYTGKTIIKYCTEKRLEHAKKRLRQGAQVSEIVEEMGYSSIYAFSRHFKDATGMSPSEYKNR